MTEVIEALYLDTSYPYCVWLTVCFNIEFMFGSSTKGKITGLKQTAYILGWIFAFCGGVLCFMKPQFVKMYSLTFGYI
jgi:hypothetical protein